MIVLHVPLIRPAVGRDRRRLARNLRRDHRPNIHLPELHRFVVNVLPEGHHRLFIYPHQAFSIAVSFGFGGYAPHIDYPGITYLPRSYAWFRKEYRLVEIAPIVDDVDVLLDVAEDSLFLNNVGVEASETAVETIHSRIVEDQVATNKRRASGSRRKPQRTAQRRDKEEGILGLVIIGVINSQVGRIFRLLGKIDHHIFAVVHPLRLWVGQRLPRIADMAEPPVNEGRRLPVHVPEAVFKSRVSVAADQVGNISEPVVDQDLEALLWIGRIRKWPAGDVAADRMPAVWEVNEFHLTGVFLRVIQKALGWDHMMRSANHNLEVGRELPKIQALEHSLHPVRHVLGVLLPILHVDDGAGLELPLFGRGGPSRQRPDDRHHHYQQRQDTEPLFGYCIVHFVGPPMPLEY